MTIRAICLDQDDVRELTRMLAAAALPTEDLQEPGRTLFKLEDEAGLIGYGGWEGRGPDRLIRSLVISPSRRGQGLGRLVLAKIEEEAQQAGAVRLHLLTTTAAPFFRANGYRDAERSDAPPNIRASHEFRSLCPASASYLVKALGPA